MTAANRARTAPRRCWRPPPRRSPERRYSTPRTPRSGVTNVNPHCSDAWKRGQASQKPAPFSLSLIGEVYRFAFLGAYGDRLFHLSVLFVHGFNYVGPRRKPLYCKRSVVARHGEEGVSDDADVRAHPGVYVALHRD